ncbi:MAG TPA: FAD-dependent oxidoreductase [Thermoleophilaceae bacterium]|nr:FAD-dependent oxidoreductase [Thermoleophilaceae bacterium]
MTRARDVIVVGAGIVGTATAYELTRRGAAVTLLDRAGISEGTTGLGEGDVLCSDKDSGPELELAVAGMAVYDELERLVGAPARIRRKGALIVHPDGRTWAAEPARAERLRAAGVHARLLDPDEVRTLEPRLTGPLHGALYVASDLQCDPRAITRALATLAADRGAEVRTGAEVTTIEPGRGVRLVGGERLRAGAVVLAAGSWSATLAASAGLQLPLEPRKGQLSRLRLPEPDPAFLRRKVVDGQYLLAVGDAGAGRQVSTVLETSWDGHVIVGSSRERSGFDTTIDEDLARVVQERAAKLVPDVARLQPDSTWVGFRPWLPDGLPAIGRSRLAEGLWVATGHEGAGVALGPITGRLLAQAITGERPSVSVSPFDPDRFASLHTTRALLADDAVDTAR